MKKGQIVEGIVTKVDFPNKGIVKVEGEEKTLIVKNAIPGQKVKASINKIRKGKAEGLSLIHICWFRHLVDEFFDYLFFYIDIESQAADK